MNLTAALVIQNCPAGELDANLCQTLELACAAAEQQADIVVFPEMNLTGYVTGQDVFSISRPLSDQLLAPVAACARKQNITILAGLAEKDEKNRIYATHVMISPNGAVQKYRKIHTAPFEQKYYTSGNKIPVFQLNGYKMGVQLCYDAHFPELSLVMAEKGADVIFMPHASPRGTSREKYDSWLRHLTARAFDNGVFIAACNQTGDNKKGLSFPGISLLVGPDGKVVSKILGNEPQTHLVTIDTGLLKTVRSHRMRYFLPNRRRDLFGGKAFHVTD